MGAIPTKEVFKRYFTEDEDAKEYQRHIIDRPELYAYEQKIGKELFDMNADELIGLISSFGQKRGKKINMPPSTCKNYVAELRKIFIFYCNNIFYMPNPMTDKKFRGNNLIRLLCGGEGGLTIDGVYKIIDNLHNDLDKDNADYIELIIWLFYCGFHYAEEILSFKTADVDNIDKTVKLKDRVIQLSDRCYDLLIKFNKLETIQGWRRELYVMSWRDSFFKFFVRPHTKNFVNEREMPYMRDKINRYLSEVSVKYGIQLNYHNLYLLGFYEYLVSNYGVRKTNDMIINDSNAELSAELLKLAKEYGFKVKSAADVRGYLTPYITY